ncbi:MAG: urate hydroxylase PuuD, partial [Bdellovibrionota bacterium]
MDIALFSFDGLLLVLRWLHVFFGIMWIGHLYYFNFTQGTYFAETDAASKSNAIQKLVPRALYWFRWGAMWTFVTGLTYLMARSHRDGMAIFATSWGVSILIGATLGLIMWANVWFVIWPNQQVVIASATAAAKGGQANPAAAALGARAGVASRTNTLFSIPLIFFMDAASHLPMSIGPNANLTLLAIVIGAII